MTYRSDLLSLSEDDLFLVEERAAIMEFDGGMTKAQAERLAMKDVLGNAHSSGSENGGRVRASSAGGARASIR
jgi:hypothetical protein